jgi:hypothetical protein
MINKYKKIENRIYTKISNLATQIFNTVVVNDFVHKNQFFI